ncbi:MAG: hypothetical protein AB7E80_16710 [Hyphomicrobiaceae bacterium]
MLDVRLRPIFRRTRLVVAATVLALTTPTAGALALEVLPDEKAGREACERRFCQIVLERKEAGPPLTCDMTKTWDRNKIKKGGQKKSISWGFGDARCKVALRLERSVFVPALDSAKYTVALPVQTVRCEIEDSDGKLKPLIVEAAPKIKFKDGRAYKAWINVKEVKGEGMVKSLVWSVSKLADSIGIFHKDTIQEINKFIYKTCEEEHGNGRKSKDKRASASPTR